MWCSTIPYDDCVSTVFHPDVSCEHSTEQPMFPHLRRFTDTICDFYFEIGKIEVLYTFRAVYVNFFRDEFSVVSY